MILLKICNLICVALILSTSIVDGKGKVSTGKKTGSSKAATPSSTHRRTTSRPVARHTTSRPIIKQTTSRPVESHRYPTQPPYNPHYQPQPQPHYPQPQPHYPQPQPHYPHPQPHYPKPQPNYPQPHYPQQNYPNQNYPHQNHYPHQTHQSWPNQPKKSHVGRNIATHAIAGLGGAYVGHQMTKHHSWYEKKQKERERERKRDGTSVTPKNRTNTNGLDKLKPITPFRVGDISDDFDAVKHATGDGLRMMKIADNKYSNDPQRNEISKAAEANMYLNMKLRPSKSETITKQNYTTEQIQTMMMSGSGLAMMSGLGAMGGGGLIGIGPPSLGAPNVFNPQPNLGGAPNVQPMTNAFGGVQPVFQPGAASRTFDPNTQNPFSQQMPVVQPQPQHAALTSSVVTDGQTNQTQTQPGAVPMTFDSNTQNPLGQQMPVVQPRPEHAALTSSVVTDGQTNQTQTQPGAVPMTFDSNSQNPFSPLVPVGQPQPAQTNQINVTISGGQSILETNQPYIPNRRPLLDPQVLPLVITNLEAEPKIRKTNGSNSMYTISNSLILISIVVIKRFY